MQRACPRMKSTKRREEPRVGESERKKGDCNFV
jgi:hypothetical protein